MTTKERMLAELPYRACDPELGADNMANRKRLYRYNNLEPDNLEEQERLIREILGKCGEKLHVEPPFRCDYGRNIEVGENFYSNYNLTVLDVARVKIGKNVMFGPNVSIYTAGHPLHPDSRNSGYEYGIGITIGDNVWIGGSSVINPGVTIGDNAVIGGGSVVTRDIPANAVAVGNPCRVIKYITEEDRKYYYKDREFDVEDYR